MKSILISDITLRESGKPNGYTLSFKEKIEIAKTLDKRCGVWYNTRAMKQSTPLSPGRKWRAVG